MDAEDIKKEAITFTKDPLSNFSKKVNEAAQEICLRKPSLLKNRGKLLILATQKVHEGGYVYRKGKSRSKAYGSGYEDASRPKRIKTTTDERCGRMQSIREELHDLRDRVAFKRKRLELAEQSKNYKLCDQLSEEIGEVNKNKRLLELELDLLEKKESKSQRYYRSKAKKGSDSDSSSSTSTSSKRPHSQYFIPPAKVANPRLLSPPPMTVSAQVIPVVVA